MSYHFKKPADYPFSEAMSGKIERNLTWSIESRSNKSSPVNLRKAKSSLRNETGVKRGSTQWSRMDLGHQVGVGYLVAELTGKDGVGLV